MSVLINGMKMPERCIDCYMCNYNSTARWYCGITNENIDLKNHSSERLEKCPLVEVHGRLIDADALLDRFAREQKAVYEHGRDFSYSFMRGGSVCTEWWPVEQMVEDAIIVSEALGQINAERYD